MQGYKDKEALLAEIKKTYQLFAKEFDDIKEQEINIRIREVDRTPQEMMAYQIGWLNLIMGWEKDELEGKDVILPSPAYKWNQLGLLYQCFYAEYDGISLQELQTSFRESVEKWCAWVERLKEEDLFNTNRRKWTVTNANWPMWKWIHMNSVAPFKSFRSKIRKWKKHRQHQLESHLL